MRRKTQNKHSVSSPGFREFRTERPSTMAVGLRTKPPGARPLSAFQRFDIGEVLRATSGALVSDKGVPPDEVDFQRPESAARATGPRLFERDAGELGQDVDASR